MRRFLLLLLGFLALPVSPALADTQSSDDSLAAVLAEVTAWFNDKAVATVRSHGAEAFPDASADEVSAMTVGSPQQTAVLDKAAMTNAIQTSGRWIAPIMSDGDAVGAVSVSFATGKATDEIVRSDKRLAAAIARDEPDVIFVWDTKLSAWFALRESTIEPADTAGAKIILGAVPLTDFLAQRDRILSSSTPVPAATAEGPAITPQNERSLPLTILLVLGVLGLFIGTLVWLRSEQGANESEETPKEEPDELAAVERKGVVGIPESKMRFRDSGRQVSVYKAPKTKDKDSSGLSDD